jgi:AP-1 complex subunit sigma 1/2
LHRSSSGSEHGEMVRVRPKTRSCGSHASMQRRACRISSCARPQKPFKAELAPQIHFTILMSRQGKVRLAKWYSTYNQKERAKVVKEVTPMILGRPLKLCNFLDWKNIKLVYKRYASLYFVCGVDTTDNELITLEIIHQFVEVLDRYFGNVCELDLIFNFHKAYYILDELLIAGGMPTRQGAAWLACKGPANPPPVSQRSSLSCTSSGTDAVVCRLTPLRVAHTMAAAVPCRGAGELQEPSKKAITRLVEAQDLLVENAKNGTDGEGQQR